MDMTSKVVVITGGGRGIGYGLAEHLAALGAAVVINDNGVDLHGAPAEPDLAERAAERIQSTGARAVGCADSIAEPATAASLVELALTTFGSLDVWINSAVITRDRMLFKMSDEEWSTVLNNNLFGTFFAMRAASAHMKEHKSGRLINLISTAGLIGNFGQSNYAAAKAGMFALTRVAALEMQRYGVCVNCVAPFAHTRMTDSIPGTTPEQQAYLARARKATVQHILPFLTYLAGDLSAGVSGQVFGVRGGEIFLFSQPRQISTISQRGGWTPKEIQEAVDGSLRPNFVSLQSDLELFDTEPIT